MSPFATLGIQPTDSDDAIRDAYRDAVRRHPPDRDPDGFRRIREAYEAIETAGKRLEYRLFGPPPDEHLTDLLEEVPSARTFAGPTAWLNVLLEHR